MSRKLRVAAAQLAGISKKESRQQVIERHKALLEEASRRKVDLVAFGETTLNPFFPRWIIDEEQRWSPKVDAYFETSMPNPSVQPLFDRAKELGIGFALGYAELDGNAHYNSYIFVGKDGKIIGKYRKSHIPGTVNFVLTGTLKGEKRYFLDGNTGYRVWSAFGGMVGMMICADRRQPESFRILGLQGAELVLVPYCTGPYGRSGKSGASDRLIEFHNQLCLQSGAYYNGCWVIGAAHGGGEDEVDYLTQSLIISPDGEIVAKSYTLEDELIDFTIDLDVGQWKRQRLAIERRPDLYKILTEPSITTAKRVMQGYLR
jgi:predicted amidohydrolase